MSAFKLSCILQFLLKVFNAEIVHSNLPHYWVFESKCFSSLINITLQFFIWPHQVFQNLPNKPHKRVAMKRQECVRQVTWDGHG